MSEKKSTKKMGRPKLPKGEAKGRIVPVRFTDAELKMFAKAVKHSEHNTLSAWIRHTLKDAAAHHESV
ncbi:MAG TPA: hypothetical protein VFR78_21165 [Pyrinomonadaceae bacterium]|nr:hypothetical protein [Pyrinomonadaceae bacterium]